MSHFCAMENFKKKTKGKTRDQELHLYSAATLVLTRRHHNN